MGWGAALRAMLKPALLVGPLLRVLGVLTVAFLAMFGSGWVGVDGIAVLAMVISVVLGLLIASPLAFVSGALMLRAGAADPRWLLRRAWALVGVLVGGGTGAAMGGVAGNAEGLFITAALLAFLGLVGALICRRMLNAPLAALGEVDADIFA